LTKLFKNKKEKEKKAVPQPQKHVAAVRAVFNKGEYRRKS